MAASLLFLSFERLSCFYQPLFPGTSEAEIPLPSRQPAIAAGGTVKAVMAFRRLTGWEDFRIIHTIANTLFH